MHTQKQKHSAAMLARLCLPSELALGYLCAIQVLGLSTGNPPGAELKELLERK